MYFVYIDESGSKDPKVKTALSDGLMGAGDSLYVLVGVALFGMNWFKFEYRINQAKLRLMEQINRDCGLQLDLSQTEIKSTAVRIPRTRCRHPFLSRLNGEQITDLVDLYYAQLEYHHMDLFAVVIDKRYLHDYFTSEMLHRKAYELLIERVEWFMRNEHRRHRALMVVDDTTRQMNCSLALKHSYFQREGTSSGCRIGHIVELPMFVESSLSNGVQLADLCAYNVHRAFRECDLGYSHFKRIAPYLYKARHREGAAIEGLKVFPDESTLSIWSTNLGHRRRNADCGHG
jgi:hypothetical protein